MRHVYKNRIYFYYREIIVIMNIKSKIKEYMRVLKISRKPTKEEFMLSSKISGIGIIIIGVIGFLIFLLFVVLGLV